MVSSEGNSNPPPVESSSTSGEHKFTFQGESKRIIEKTRAEIFKLHVNGEKTPTSFDVKQAAAEVNEATTRMVVSVDQITDVLLLILGKFDTTIRRINAGAILAIMVGVAVLSVIVKVDSITEKMEHETKASEEVRKKLESALLSLHEVKKSQKKTEVSVEEVKQQTSSKSEIKIVPDEDRPGRAKVVISSERSSKSEKPVTQPSSPTPVSKISKSELEKSKDVSIEIPIDLPKAKVLE
jgi:hypothetical protein